MAEKKSFVTLLITILVPLTAISVSGWTVFKYFDEKGPVIRVQFDSADGIEPGKTPLKFHGITVGKVEQIDITDDLHHVLFEIRLMKKAAHVANKSSKFWIVKPEASLNKISNLETIVSGAYIAVEPPGHVTKESPGHQSCFFVGQLKRAKASPVHVDKTNDLAVKIKAPHAFSSAKVDAKVFYKGFPVGVIEEIELARSGKNVIIEARIFEDYKHLVRTNSIFWTLKLLDFEWKLTKGFKIRNVGNPVQTALEGGIAFATPELPGAYVGNNYAFTMSRSFDKTWLSWQPNLLK